MKITQVEKSMYYIFNHLYEHLYFVDSPLFHNTISVTSIFNDTNIEPLFKIINLKDLTIKGIEDYILSEHVALIKIELED